MTGNKQHFIDLIIKLWKGEIIQDYVTRNILPVEPHTVRQKLHQPAQLLQSSARSGVPIPSHPLPAQPIAAPKALPQQSLPHVFNEIKSRMVAILNTPEKVQVYNILCGYPGIKREEILSVLSVWSPSTVVNPDEVMLKIIAKRQVTGIFVLVPHVIYNFLKQICTLVVYVRLRKVNFLWIREWKTSRWI